MVTEVKNAIIESVSLSNADHGCLSAWLNLTYDGSGQGFGGFSLYLPKNYSPNYAGHFIWRCMEIGGVYEWSKLPGRTIRALSNHCSVISIGHIIKDDWFTPSEDFKKMEAGTF